MEVSYENDIATCIEILNKGGLILYPTDTVWGVGCDATNELSVKRVYALKKRDDHKALVILLAANDELLKYIPRPNPAIFEIIEKIKKPTTVIYDGATGLALNLHARDGSAAIRIVKDEFCKDLISRFGKPIVSTSANISGMPTPGNFARIHEEIKTGVDYIVQHRQHETKIAMASTVMKWNSDGTVTIIRN